MQKEDWVKHTCPVELDRKRPFNPISVDGEESDMAEADSIRMAFEYYVNEESKDSVNKKTVRAAKVFQEYENSFTKDELTIRTRTMDVVDDQKNTGGGKPIIWYLGVVKVEFDLRLGNTDKWKTPYAVNEVLTNKFAGFRLVSKRYLYEKSIRETYNRALAKATQNAQDKARAMAEVNNAELVFPAYSTIESGPQLVHERRQLSSQPASYVKMTAAPSYEQSPSDPGSAAEMDPDKNPLIMKPIAVEVRANVSLVYESVLKK